MFFFFLYNNADLSWPSVSLLRSKRLRVNKKKWPGLKEETVGSSLRLGSALGEKGEVAWGGERGGSPFPLPRPPLGSLRSPIFFLFNPVFCLFLPLRSLAPGQVGRRSKSVSFLWVVTSTRWPCLLHPYKSVGRGRKEDGTKAPVSWTLWLVPSRH